MVAKLGLDQFPGSPEDLDAFVRFTQDASSSFERLVGSAEGVIYTLSDAAVETVNSMNEKQGDWLSGITYLLESVLKVIPSSGSTRVRIRLIVDASILISSH